MGGTQPISSPAVVDVNGDGIEEVFLTYWLAGTQWVSGWRLDGTVVPGFPQVIFAGTDMNAHSSVHVADANGDGVLDLAVSGNSSSAGKIWVMPIPGSVYDPATTRADWPKMRHDVANLGRYVQSNPASVANPAGTGARLSAWPNPLPRGQALNLGPAAGPGGRLTVVDVRGAVLSTITVDAPGGIAPRDLFGRPDAATGAYFLRWESPGVRQTGRLVLVDR
jgi:hypothetical protein